MIERFPIKKIIFLAHFQIETDDGMPDKLCKECTEKAYLAYNFKITIEQNDSTLRSVLMKDHIESIKKDAEVFDENNTYLGLGIKTEIAFVDADPFIDDDADFDYVNTTTENSNSVDHHQQQQQLDNNNSYQQDDQEEILQLEGNEEEEEELGEEMEGEEIIEEELDENLEIASKDKFKKKEHIDYIKDEDGKFICQICNKKLADKKGLNLHIRLHTGKDLKRCHICNRGKREIMKFIKIPLTQFFFSLCRLHQKRSPEATFIDS